MLSLEQQNRWRERYQTQRPGWQPATAVYAAWVQAQLSAGGRLLDLGCGRGGLVEQLEPGHLTIVGIDPDITSLRDHRQPTLPRAAAISDLIPMAAGVFDVVIATWLLEHLADPAATFGEIERVLRPGGVLLFLTPHARHPLTVANRIIGRMGRWQGKLVEWLYKRAEADTFLTTYRANTVAELERLAAAAGLVLETVQVIADPTYLAFNEPLFRLSCWLDDRLGTGLGIHLVGQARKPAAGSEHEVGR